MATKWGCIGPGKISSDFFLAVQDNLPKSDHEFIAVASLELSRAQKFADTFKFQRAYDSYDELAEDKDVEVVYIGTINTNHAELSIKMLQAGKHVLCEKPMAMNYKQTKQVLDVAKAMNRVFIEAMWTRWFPASSTIRQELAAGLLGSVKLIQACFCVPILGIERINNRDIGGGGLLDIGIYLIQFATMVFREMPESITAVGNIVGDVDESACITLKYKTGAFASLVYHTNAGRGHNTAHILGTKGRIDVSSPFHAPVFIKTPVGEYSFPLKDGEYFFENSAGLQYEAQSIRECIKNGQLESAVYTHEDIELVHKIMDEIRRQICMVYPDFD